jgi:uncharacterized protein YqeY
MSLKEQIQEDLKNAMKTKDALRLSVIRLAKAAIMNKEIALGHELSDAEILEVLSKEAKQRTDSIPEYEKAGRNDIVDNLRQELTVLQGYLPAQLSEAEITQIVQETIAEVGASSKREMGKVMAALMPKVRGKADGKLVNQIVGSLLGD